MEALSLWVKAYHETADGSTTSSKTQDGRRSPQPVAPRPAALQLIESNSAER